MTGSRVRTCVNTPILDTLHHSVTDRPRRVAAMPLTCPESPVNHLDVAIAVARAAIVVGVLVTAVALRDGIGGLGRCGGRRRGWCSGRGVRRRQMMVTVRRSRWLRRGVLCCHGGAAARGQRREQ